MEKILFKEESYDSIGKCMEVHNNLGAGFLEIVYKDALEYEFRKADIPYEREKIYEVNYKGIILPHRFVQTLLCMVKSFSKLKVLQA